ncbi:BppU family phage baseplate upper protein [Staphylococcus saprophyticus]|uniref:BppU family phage baseplate upper protein n=1 Tax=Staphylococcus saprophyticus TaxID=29385 RepID=UPI0015E89738|nr:BppU family phage baseplate upper protein [Staphylococcus saprophyticus]
MDGMQKVAKLLVNDEPYLKPISDQGIGFYNMDENTGVLQFQVRRENYPLEVSPVNTNIYGYFIADNGSTTGKVDVEYLDPMNGIIRIILDSNFLKASTDNGVTGQLYIKAIGKKDTVVLNEFRFTVKDALINKVDGDIKISYIREVDDLIDNFKAKMANAMATLTDIEDLKEEFTDYANAQMDMLKLQISDMTEELKALTSRTQIEITDQVNDIDEKVKNTLQELENGTANVITEDELLAKLADYTTNEQFTSVTDNKADKTDIPTDIPNTENLDTIITAKVQEKVDAIISQKYVLTDEKGYIPRLDDLDMEVMNGINKSGWFYVYAPVNSPDEDNGNGYLQVFARSSTYVKAVFMPFNSHKIYTRNQMGTTAGWGKWREITGGYTIPTKSEEEEDFEDLENVDDAIEDVETEDLDNVDNDIEDVETEDNENL